MPTHRPATNHNPENGLTHACMMKCSVSIKLNMAL